MKSFGNLDLYTGLILVCTVLLPACAWWCMKTNEEIVACERTVREATRRGGLLEQIGALQKKIDTVNQSRGQAPTNAGNYFGNQIVYAAAAGGVDNTDFSLIGPKQEVARLGGSKQKAIDHVVEVEWKNKEKTLQLDFIESLLWNCESGAGQGAGTGSGLQSIWKLQQLVIANATDKETEKLLERYYTPPPELGDRWTIRDLKFARREPSK